MSKWKALVAAGGFTFFLSTQANAQDDPLTVIYLGAKDCRSCQVFDRYQKETFKQKVAAKGMNFREFKVDSLRYIRQTSAWPADLKWLLDILVSELEPLGFLRSKVKVSYLKRNISRRSSQENEPARQRAAAKRGPAAPAARWAICSIDTPSRLRAADEIVNRMWRRCAR